MKKVMVLLLALCLIPVGIAASFALAGDHGQEQVTLCHAAGLAGTTQYVTITVGYPAAFGPAGHFDENGTPNAGHEQDYLGACEGDETTPTTTTPTTTTPTTTTPTTPTVTEPPHVVTGAASVICDGTVYRISGTVDGQAADSVVPSVLPGSTKGTTNVVVTKGDTTFRTSVTTNGDCGPPPANSTQPTQPTTPAPTTTTPPRDITAGPPAPPDTTTSTPGGPAAGQPTAPPAEESSPGKPSEANPPVGAPAKPAPGQPCPPGTREHNGTCNAIVRGKG